MSSAINHKKRSHRGYKVRNSHLAHKNSPMINTHNKAQRKAFSELLSRMFRRMISGKEG